MNQKDIDYAVISNIINVLSVMCAANKNCIIDELTGFLWDSEEAGCIKKSSDKYLIK